jgi:hypothetical protein
MVLIPHYYRKAHCGTIKWLPLIPTMWSENKCVARAINPCFSILGLLSVRSSLKQCIFDVSRNIVRINVITCRIKAIAIKPFPGSNNIILVNITIIKYSTAYI